MAEYKFRKADTSLIGNPKIIEGRQLYCLDLNVIKSKNIIPHNTSFIKLYNKRPTVMTDKNLMIEYDIEVGDDSYNPDEDIRTQRIMTYAKKLIFWTKRGEHEDDVISELAIKKLDLLLSSIKEYGIHDEVMTECSRLEDE